MSEPNGAAHPATTKTKCLPVYLVFDTSGSMNAHTQLLNDTLDFFYRSVVESPRVSEFAHISIINFSTNAHVALGMTDVQDIQSLPEFSCDGRTDYGKAFRLIQQQIDHDVPNLNAKGKAVLRPAVFFMTDGVPTDPGWETAFGELVAKDWRRYPHVITWGFGNARQDVLSKIATKGAFIAKQHTGNQQAITEIITSMLRTLVASAKAETLQIPKDVEGFTSLPVEYMP
jgi:uncharacterized protein YegL